MNELLAYRRERLPWPRFGGLALLLTLLGGGLELVRLPMVGLAYLLVATFRLRDDLADRERDRVAHPERVLVRAPTTRPFELAFVTGLLAAGVWLAATQSLVHAALLFALALALELGYRLGLPARWSWVLLKYPAFVLLLAGSLDSPTIAMIALVYLSFLLFERIDDPSLRAHPHARTHIAASLAAAGLIAAIHLRLAAGAPLWLVALAGVWAFVATLALTGRGSLAALALFFLTLLVWSHDHLCCSGAGHARDAQLLQLR